MAQPSSPTLYRIPQNDAQVHTPPITRIQRPLHHQPPVNIVVVRETPPRIRSNIRQETPRKQSSTGRIIPGNSSPSLSSTFRLQPRGKPIATPSPSSRGRKRNAQCLSTNIATPLSSRNILSPETAQVAPSPESSTNQGMPIWESTPSSNRLGSERSALESMKCSPSRVENALQTLSIRSPRSGGQDDLSNHSSSTAVAVRPGSSFILYTSSPLGASYVRPRNETNGSNGSATIHCSSPSSTKSSPKIAPLTVLQQDSEDMMTPTQRPPLHLGPSSLLISIDSNHDTERVNDVPQDTLERQGQATESLRPINPRTPEHSPKKFCHSSPAKMLHESSPSQLSTRKSSPRTPLPRVKLTPKGQKRHEALSMASTSDQDFGFLSSDFIFKRSSRPPLFVRDNKARNDAQQMGEIEASSRKCDQKEAKATSQIEKQRSSPCSPPLRKQSYLPFPDWCDELTSQHADVLMPTLKSPSMPESNKMEHASKTIIPVVETKSLLTPSKSGSLLSDMIEADERAAAMDADDGSLTDPDDDDDSFILQNPASFVEERQCSGRARQRQRLSYHSLDLNVRQSSNSLAMSTQASNTSLLGMAFIQQGDSSSSLIQPDNTAVPSLPPDLKRVRSGSPENCGKPLDTCQNKSPNNILRREKSEESLSSIGLALDPTSEESREGGRDLRTPPAITTTCSSPPPLSADLENEKATPTTSVYISRSDPDAVNLTISRMVFHAHQSESPRMESS